MKKILYLSTILIISSFLFFCSTDKSPLPSVTHATGWNLTTSDEFHGAKVISAGYQSCKTCHGEDLTGGETQISCFECHQTYPHLENWNQLGSSDFHGQFIREDNWSLASCQSCHGEDNLGGKSGSSCYACHQDEGGPEACNNCHGSQDNPAPPEDLNNNVAASEITVGAHQLHILDSLLCESCHLTPVSVSQEGHIDSSPDAEVNADLTWNRTNGTCTSTCHTDTTKAHIWNNF